MFKNYITKYQFCSKINGVFMLKFTYYFIRDIEFNQLFAKI